MFKFLTTTTTLPGIYDNHGWTLGNVFRYCPKTQASEVGDTLSFKFATQDESYEEVTLTYNHTTNQLQLPDGSYSCNLQGFFSFVCNGIRE